MTDYSNTITVLDTLSDFQAPNPSKCPPAIKQIIVGRRVKKEKSRKINLQNITILLPTQSYN